MTYSFEGTITTRPQIESLIGHFGLEATLSDPGGNTTRTLVAVAPEDALGSIAEQWRIEQGLPPDVPTLTQYIGTPEAAERYATPTTQDFRAQSQDTDTLEDAVAALVPKDHELFAASVEVWKERRLPSSKRYVLARGKLLTVVGFDLEQGWHPEHHTVGGSRIVTGIVTPNRQRTKTRVKTTFTGAPVTYTR